MSDGPDGVVLFLGKKKEEKREGVVIKEEEEEEREIAVRIVRSVRGLKILERRVARTRSIIREDSNDDHTNVLAPAATMAAKLVRKIVGGVALEFQARRLPRRSRARRGTR